MHRRVLFAMSELNNTYNRPYMKSARVVGEVIGKYHPHGDSAVYDTIVRMAQDFSMRYLLVDGQGNFGSDVIPRRPCGTEVRMSKMADPLLAIWTRKRWISSPTMTKRFTCPPCCLPACLISW